MTKRSVEKNCDQNAQLLVCYITLCVSNQKRFLCFRRHPRVNRVRNGIDLAMPHLGGMCEKFFLIHSKCWYFAYFEKKYPNIPFFTVLHGADPILQLGNDLVHQIEINQQDETQDADRRIGVRSAREVIHEGAVAVAQIHAASVNHPRMLMTSADPRWLYSEARARKMRVENRRWMFRCHLFRGGMRRSKLWK